MSSQHLLLQSFDTLTDGQKAECVDDICYTPDGTDLVFYDPVRDDWYALTSFILYNDKGPTDDDGNKWDAHQGTSYFTADVIRLTENDHGDQCVVLGRISW